MEHVGPNLLSMIIDELEKTEFSGTVHICPCANPLALELDYEFYPECEDLTKIDDYFYSRFRHDYCPWGLDDRGTEKRYNMNRLWGGEGGEGVAGEIVQWLWREICAPADAIIDMHCLQASKPLIYSVRESIPLAKYFGAELLFPHEPVLRKDQPGNLMDLCARREKCHSFCVEFSSQHAIKQPEYEWGRQGVKNIMIAMEMLGGEVVVDHPTWVLGDSNQSFESDSHGHVIFYQDLFEVVEKGAKIFEIRDLQTVEILGEGYAEMNGVVSYQTHLPVVNDGSLICRVSTAEQLTLNDIP